MKTEITEQEALSRLAALCSRGEHSSGERIEKMQRWQLDEMAQARILERLVHDKYVDDERFARAFIHDKLRYNHWGRRKIEQALWQKGVDRDVYAPLLDAVSDEDYLAELRPLLRQKSRSVKADSDYERNMKLIKFALGRGFTMDIIRQCIDGAEDIADEG